MNNHPNYGRADAFVTIQRLVAENGRLRAAYAQSQAMTARNDLLLREADHRVKNSLQVVASLLGLQARRARNPATKDALHAAATRILVVAHIHDALQLSASKDSVDVGALIATMCESLDAMAGDSHSIQITVKADIVHTPPSLAQPILLAVNELIINALRHAFPPPRGGTITVTVAKRDDVLRISIADNGVGLPDHYSDATGYGATLVSAMIEKVGGKLSVEGSNGARFTLSAPLPAAQPSRDVVKSAACTVVGTC